MRQGDRRGAGAAQCGGEAGSGAGSRPGAGIADNCRRVRLSFPWLVSGRLPARERLALYQHLSICPACRTELAGHLALASAVTRAMAALRDPPEGLAQAVLAQLPGAGTTDERGRKQAAPGLVFVRFLLDSVKSPGLPGLALDSFQWALSTAAGI